MVVTLKARHVVTPSEPTWRGILPLSELDQIGLVSHTSVLYYYDRPTKKESKWLDRSGKKVINTLKDSLSQVLVHFYPLAGRLRWLAGNRLELECNAMGVELIEAESNEKITNFGNFVDSSKSMFRDLLAHVDYKNTPIQEIPLLSVQVTRFACGGICLGMQTSHVSTDGRCAFHFYKEWARLARGEPLKDPPFIDRLPLKYTHVQVDNDNDVDHSPFADWAEYKLSDEVEDDKIERRVPTLVVVITKDQIEILKKVANEEMELTRPYGRFEVVTAHAWRCMTMAREPEPEPDQIMSLCIMADGRNRFDPPLPSSFFGNAVLPVSACSSAEKLVSNPLSYACSKVREAVQQMTNEYLRDAIEFFGKEKSLRVHQFMEDRGDMVGNINSSYNTWVISWLNLFSQGLDFGWGDEIYAGPPTGLGDGTNVLITPYYPVDSGSLKLAIGSSDEEKFLKNFNLFWDQ